MTNILKLEIINDSILYTNGNITISANIKDSKIINEIDKAITIQDKLIIFFENVEQSTLISDKILRDISEFINCDIQFDFQLVNHDAIFSMNSDLKEIGYILCKTYRNNIILDEPLSAVIKHNKTLNYKFLKYLNNFSTAFNFMIGDEPGDQYWVGFNDEITKDDKKRIKKTVKLIKSNIADDKTDDYKNALKYIIEWNCMCETFPKVTYLVKKLKMDTSC